MKNQPTKAEKRRRMWKWLLITCAAGVVVGTPTLYFGGKYYLEQRSQHWRQLGVDALAAKDYEKAGDYLIRYIRRHPNDVDTLEKYVEAREHAEVPNGQNIADTIGALKAIIGQKPDSMQDRRHLLDIYVRIERRPEALEMANAILSKFPKDPELLGIKTTLLAAQHQDRDALTTAEKWLEVATDVLPPNMARIQARFRLGQPPDVIVNDVKQLAEAHPNDPRFELLLGHAYIQVGNDALAIETLKSAAKHADPRASYIPLLVTQFDTLGIAAESIAVLQELVNRGASPDIRHTLARRLWEQAKWQDAAALLVDVDPAQSHSDATLLALRAITLSNLVKTTESAACRSALSASKNAAAQAWSLLLPRIIENATCDDKAIIKACRQALALDSQNMYLLYYLGDANARLGELDLAIDAWRRAMSAGPMWTMPPTRLVEGLLQKGKPEEALLVARNAARRNPTSANAIIALARAWSAGLDAGDVGNADDLLNMVTQVQTQLPGEEETLLIQVQLLCKQQKRDDAIKVVHAALTQTKPLQEDCIAGLAALSRKYHLGLEQECYARGTQTYPGSLKLAASQAIGCYTATSTAPTQADATAGLALFDDLAKQAGKTEDREWKLVRTYYLDLTGNPAAVDAWRALGEQFPTDLKVQTVLTRAPAVKGNWEIVTKAIDRLRAITDEKDVTKGLTWRLAQARLYVESARSDSDYSQGSLLLNDLLKEFPGMPELHVLLARALIQMKLLDAAVEHLTLAAKLDPTSANIAIELATQLQVRGDFHGVQRELERIAPQLHTSDQRRLAANVLAQAGAADQAITLMEKPLDVADDQPKPQNDLFMAMLYRRRNELAKAQALVEKLLETPDQATILFAASLYLAENRPADAQAVLQKLDALKLAPGVKEVIWGSFYNDIGDAEKSLAQYQAAVERAPTNPAVRRTLACVQVIRGNKAEALATLAQAAKALPEDKGFQAISQQTALLQDAFNDGGLETTILVFLRDPLSGGSDAAVDMMKLVTEGRQANDAEKLAARLQQFIERHTDFYPAYMRLAQCYHEMNRPSDAYNTAQRAMTIFPNDPDPARVATQLAYSQGHWPEMRTTAEAWKKRLAGTNLVEADLALARAFNGLQQYDSARLCLAPYLSAAQAEPQRFAAVLATYAGILVNLDQNAQAEQLLWPLAQKESTWRNIWIETSLTFRDAKQTIAWLQRVQPIIPPDAVRENLGLAEAWDVLGRRTKDIELQKKAATLTAQVAQRAEKDLLAQLTAANQAERVGDPATAEIYYRRALALDPGQVVANNNLAMILIRRGGGTTAKEAVTFAATASKAAPRSATVYDTYALALASNGNHKAAADTIKTALKLEPDNLQYQVRLAQYLLDGGDQAQAINKLREISQSRNLATLTDAAKAQLATLRKRAKLDT